MRINVVMLDVKKMNQVIYPDTDIPLISFCGKWLIEAGFQPGDAAVGEVFENAILIRKVNKMNENDFKNIYQKVKS